MIIGLDKSIGIKFQEYVRANGHKLTQNQKDALIRYANNPDILSHLSHELFQAHLADRDHVTFNSESKKFIDAILEAYK